ncbi:MAG TPA: hypothetical protein VFO89_16475 [Thermoanaerobaculia bacterium]|nr:hypothetical protein [Thermoanaerobaculia bacterium]
MAQISRRSLVQSAPFLLAAIVRCTNALDARTRLAEAFIVDPSWAAYQPTLRGLITAILPFEVAGFPSIAAGDVEQRLIDLFPIEQELRFLGLQRTMVLFDQLDLFASMSGPLAQEESKARDLVARGGDAAGILRGVAAADESAFAAFAQEHAIAARGVQRFRDLPLGARRAYFALWRDSASIVKREFHHALRALVMVTTYSMDVTWPHIGYAGPLLPGTAGES